MATRQYKTLKDDQKIETIIATYPTESQQTIIALFKSDEYYKLDKKLKQAIENPVSETDWQKNSNISQAIHSAIYKMKLGEELSKTLEAIADSLVSYAGNSLDIPDATNSYLISKGAIKCRYSDFVRDPYEEAYKEEDGNTLDNTAGNTVV